MIIYTTDNIFDSNTDCLVNPVNCFGVSGVGLALEFKKRYPNMFEQYRLECRLQQYRIGRTVIYGKGRYGANILFFPTKYHYSSNSNERVIERGLEDIVAKNQNKVFIAHNICSISFPQLGCGRGGLKWKIVKPLMEKYLSDLPLEIYIHTRES